MPWDSVEDLRYRIARLRRYCAELPRDPDEVEVSVQVMVRPSESVAEVRAEAAEYLAAGADHIVLVLPGQPDDRAVLAALADALGDLFTRSPRRVASA